MFKTLEWTNEGVRFLDQTKLPTEESYVTCSTYEEVADVIRKMVVRGAPAIGVAAAMGIALGTRDAEGDHVSELRRNFDQICETMGETRPTAMNLFWAIRRMQSKFEASSDLPVEQIKHILITEAQRMYLEDIAASEAMGRHGAVKVGQSPRLAPDYFQPNQINGYAQQWNPERRSRFMPMKRGHFSKVRG